MNVSRMQHIRDETQCYHVHVNYCIPFQHQDPLAFVFSCCTAQLDAVTLSQCHFYASAAPLPSIVIPVFEWSSLHGSHLGLLYPPVRPPAAFSTQSSIQRLLLEHCCLREALRCCDNVADERVIAFDLDNKLVLHIRTETLGTAERQRKLCSCRARQLQAVQLPSRTTTQAVHGSCKLCSVSCTACAGLFWPTAADADSRRQLQLAKTAQRTNISEQLHDSSCQP